MIRHRSWPVPCPCLVWLLVAALALPAASAARGRRSADFPVLVDAPEGTKGLDAYVRAAGERRGGRRVAFLAGAFLGRPYSAATKKRVKKQRQGGGAEEARNARPLVQPDLVLHFGHMDCMTYVENVVALAHAEAGRPPSLAERALDLRFDARGLPVYQHERSHFMSVWAAANVRKGYLRDVTAEFSATATRRVHLNRREGIGTFYVKDAFLRYPEPVDLVHVTRAGLLAEEAKLRTGDLLLWIRDIEGLDVAHVGFYVRKGATGSLRHASYSANRIQDEPFAAYVEGATKVLGARVLRPLAESVEASSHRCVAEGHRDGRPLFRLRPRSRGDR